MSSASRYQVRSPIWPSRPSKPLNQGPTGTVEKPRGSKPASPSMDPSRGAGAKGRAWEGPALAQALALGDPPEDLGTAAGAAFFLPREKVMVGAV